MTETTRHPTRGTSHGARTLTPSDLARIPRRLCVVSGRHKVRGILGALRSGAVTDLVIDDLTAEDVLEHLDSRGPAALV